MTNYIYQSFCLYLSRNNIHLIMSQHRKTNHRKTSENDIWQQIEQPLHRTSESSTRRPIYPNVPKRTQRISSINEQEIIQTESRIFITPSQKPDDYSSITSPIDQNAYTRQTLDLITKYTSPQKRSQESHHCSLSAIQSQIDNLSNDESIYASKSKRSLSPMDETNQDIHESKRTKSFDDNDDDELSQLLDHRYNKRNSSQNSTTTSLSQSTIDGTQRKTTVRKPTARKLSGTQPKPIASQTQPIEKTPVGSPETLIIEPDLDTEDDIINREETSWLSKRSHISNEEHNGHTEPNDDTNQSRSTQIELPIDSFNSKQNICFTPVKNPIPTRSPSNSAFKQTPPDNFSPCSTLGERRFSSTSSSSLLFHTPRSSCSRMTTTDMISPSQTVIKIDHDTQISSPSNIDMLNQLISQMNLNVNNNQKKIDYNPIELSKKLFHQYNSFSLNNRFHAMNSLIKKQFLNYGRYQIEILFPINHDKIPTIYACDICLKHFHGSSIAFQRHTSKCFCIQPPGKLVFEENDLAIFQIGETTMNIEQRIYIKSLCRITRLFIDSNKTIDDTKIDRFAYYILCRRDPILSQPQSSLYRFIGYFSKQLNQNTQQSITNLSCLSILPPFAQHKEYNQLLIAFSYFLIRSNASSSLMYSSPARPLDNLTLSSFRTYWRDVIFAYIINQNHSSITTIALDTFSRQTSIHPRDILSTLVFNKFIASHPTDKSSVYFLNNAYHSMTCLNLHMRNKLLFMDMKLIVTDNEKKTMIDKQNNNKTHVTGIEEIVLD